MKGVSQAKLIAAIFLTLVYVLYMGVTGSPGRWDIALKLRFLTHRADFEKLVVMANEDAHVTRIAPDFTWLDDDLTWPRKNVGISEQRWEEYRRLFRRVGAPVGIEKNPYPVAVFFPIVSRSLVPAGWTKGLVYSSTPLTPVLKSLDERPPDKLWEGKHVLVYEPIRDDWYIYYEEW